VIHPDTIKAHMEGGTIYGLSAALENAITIRDGRVEQQHFGDYQVMRINEAPEIDVAIIADGAAPGGIGEPTTALVAPALYNAIYAATGRRLRSMPLARHGLA
jgi:isoquinoline 1-oxidoreductase beta subunit